MIPTPGDWRRAHSHHLVMDSAQPTVLNDTAAGRFELTVDGQTAFLTYTIAGDRIRMIHTEVPPGLQGHGYANQLARAALDFARREKLRVVPLCPFVRSYIQRHPEDASLVTPGA